MGRLALIIFAVFFAVEAHAGVSDYWVSHKGTSTWSNCQSDSEVTGVGACAADTAWKNVSAGQTVWVVDSGPYSGSSVFPQNSGTDDGLSRINIMAAPGEQPHFTAALELLKLDNSPSYIRISGIRFSNPTNSNFAKVLDVNGASFIRIENCLFDNIVGDTQYQTAHFENSTDLWIIDTIFDAGDYTFNGQFDFLDFRNVDRVLLLRVTALHATHNVVGWNTAASNNIAIIDSTFSNKWHTAVGFGLQGGSYGIITGSTIYETGYADASNPYTTQRGGFGPGLTQGAGTYKIARENVFRDVDVSINLRPGSADSDNWTYHNTVYNGTKPVGGGSKFNNGMLLWAEAGAGTQFTDRFFFNNLLWESENGRQFMVYAAAGTNASGNSIFSNLIGSSGSSQWGVYEGSTQTPNSVTWHNANNGVQWQNNLTATSGFESALNPDFVDPTGATTGTSNFNVNSGSTVIDKGTGLTYTVSDGTDSVEMTVERASGFFTAGGTPWNIPAHPDVVADTIYFKQTGGGYASRLITGTTNAAGNQQIRLASAASWDSGVSVYHRSFSGSAPEIGKYEFTAKAATLGTITFGGSGTISFGGDGVIR